MPVYFTVTVGRKFWDSIRSPLNRGGLLVWSPLNAGFTVENRPFLSSLVHLFQNESLCKALYRNEFENEPADEAHFHANGFARYTITIGRDSRK